MSVGVSLWWATPAESGSHFSAEELARSERYHRPLRLVGLAGLAARVALLAGAAAVAGSVLSPRLDPWPAEVGAVEAVLSTRVLVAAGLTAVALRLPSTIVDGWFEFGFRRGVEGYEVVPRHRFALTGLAMVLGTWAVLIVVAALGYGIAASYDRWPVALAVAGVAVAVISAALERPFRAAGPAAERPLDPESEAFGDVGLLAERFGLRGLRFAIAEPDRGGRSALEAAPNAYAVGLGPNRRVVVTPALLDEPDGTRRFVVAHELTHLARHHLAVQAAAAAAMSLMVVVAIAVVVDADQPWRRLGLDADDPLGLPVVVLTVLAAGAAVSPLAGWLSRAQERSADAGAISAVGSLEAGEARRLHLATMSDLDPPWWVRLYAIHPAPAERLEYLARARRRE